MFLVLVSIKKMHGQIRMIRSRGIYGLSGNFDSTIHLPNWGMCWLEVCMLDLWASMSAESVVWYSHWSQENNIISLPVTFVLFCTCNQQHGHIWITYQFISTGISTHLLLFPRKVNHHYHGTGYYSTIDLYKIIQLRSTQTPWINYIKEELQIRTGSNVLITIGNFEKRQLLSLHA